MSIADSLARVRERIDRAARAAGRDPAAVRLVAVSKMQPPEAIREAYEAGHRCFGENYVQELRGKQAELGDLEELLWHFIGHLQRNKARQVAGNVSMVETVDSPRLASELDKRARAAGVVLDVLLQVNVVGEASKSGCAPEELPALIEAASAAEALRVCGLMTIPPFDLDPEEARPCFAALRRLRDQSGGPAVLPDLSMGMSGDYHVAVEEGATSVRVGTAIFGERGHA